MYGFKYYAAVHLPQIPNVVVYSICMLTSPNVCHSFNVVWNISTYRHYFVSALFRFVRRTLWHGRYDEV